MKSDRSRINNIIGQLNGVSKMMDENKDCLKVLTQLKAVRAAVTSLMNKVIDNQFENCMTSVSREDKKMLSQIKNYVKAN